MLRKMIQLIFRIAKIGEDAQCRRDRIDLREEGVLQVVLMERLGGEIK